MRKKSPKKRKTSKMTMTFIVRINGIGGIQDV